jgi:hypothetical protein
MQSVVNTGEVPGLVVLVILTLMFTMTATKIPTGYSYINDTGLDKFIVLTGSRYFEVREIEVFEITD